MAGVVATIAGADPRVAVTLAVSMLLLQLAIGAVNDWADAPADAVARPGKPIPSGMVPRAWALRIAVPAAAAGLVLAAITGPATLLLGGVGFATGLAYDLRLKGTRWSWVPYAIGVPLLPLFAWVGATGTVPLALGVLLAVAMASGAALAIANGVADVERDERAGVETVATSLGIAMARRVGAVLQATVVVAALASAVVLGAGPAAIAVCSLGGGVVAIGVGLGWASSGDWRQRAWELQAVGLAITAAGWLAGVAAAGALAAGRTPLVG